MRNRRRWARIQEDYMNNSVFAGRVGNDAELTYTKDGKAVASFSVAVDNGKDREGEKRKPTWVKAVLWEKRAEALAPHIKKGSMVVVSGRVSSEAWISKQSGDVESKIVITVNDFTFGGSPKSNDESSAPAQAARPVQAAAPIPIDDSDIPF